MRSLRSFALVVVSAVSSGLLVMMSQLLLTPPTRPWVGLYEYQPTPAQESKLDFWVGFFNWNDPDLLVQIKAFLDESRQKRRVPLLNLEPFANETEGRSNSNLLNDVRAGHYDQRLRALGEVLAAEPSVVLLRFGHEMDKTGQYAWSFVKPKDYISLYHYVYEALNSSDIPHVRWVWSPAGSPEAYRFWPGNSYVDLIGISAYASRAWTADRSLESFSEILERNRWLQRRYSRPLLVAEAGVSGSAADQQSWLQDALIAMSRYPEVCGLVYFQAPQPSWMPLPTGHEDWQLKQGPLKWLLQHLPLPERRGLSCVEA
jgi:beta-mannanase